MNVQTNKKILFNKSTLFSLKAELLKKQEEVIEKKKQPQNRIENYKPPVPKQSTKEDDKPRKKTFKESLVAVDTEELEACRKSKAALEKKAELYEHLSDGAGTSQLAGRFLVDFKTKQTEEAKETKLIQEDEPDDDKIEKMLDNDDDWTEFTDCLGRTRKCLKSDIELFAKRDQELMKIMSKDVEDDKQIEPKEPPKEKPFLVQKTNDYLQSLREKWEKKEEELLAKDRDIHYQDLLFDEARIHGVGYYSFSTDEAERKKQMEELIKQRELTLKAQKQAEEIRRKRDEVIAARVKAARARQRARAGLPPEEETENEKDFTTCLLEFLTQQKNEADAKAKEEERKKKEEIEKEKQKLREVYVREWDMGKEGVDDKVKKFREMTQEEYVEQQRSKRIDEFAPPSTSVSKSDNYFDDRGNMRGNEAPKTWSDVRPTSKTSPPPTISIPEEQKGLYFSSKKVNEESIMSREVYSEEAQPQSSTGLKRDLKYRNFVKAQEPVPIVNEISDEETEQVESGNNERLGQGTEIAPPPTYDYYGPVPKRSKQQKPFDSDIREAYAQGAKSLETKSNARNISKQYDFTFD